VPTASRSVGNLARLAGWAASRAGLLAISRERCRRSLVHFIREAWEVIEPANPYVHGWHIDAIAAHLEGITAGRFLEAGQSNRLLVNVPPGAMKSLCVSVFWPAWEWGPRGLRGLRYLATSHSERYATRDSRRMRQLITSDWFQERWPEVRLIRAGESSFENADGGFREGVPFQSLTGSRGDRVIVDDPHSTETAESDAERARAVRIFRESVPTRLNDPVRSAIVVVMQRLHEADIAGEALAKGLGYEHLMLPMRFEADRRCETCIGFADPRETEGELLFAERFPEPEVAALEKALGSYAAAGQLQQRPAPRGGALIEVDKIEVVDAIPNAARVRRAWDLAGTDPTKAKGDPDWTVGAKVGVHDGLWYIMDIRRDRQGPFGVERMVRLTAELDGRLVPIAIEQEPGSAGKATIQHYQRRILQGWAMTGVASSGAKVERARAFIAAVEAGNVRMVRAEWNEALIGEMRTFPAGAHDDQVDAVVLAFNGLATESTFYIGEL
jgi:predicted phage terminase large subunit-like protein